MIVGTDGPAVLLDARTCAWLEKYAGLSSLRVRVRGTDPHVSTQLEELRYVAMSWRGQAATGQTGHPVDAVADTAAPSRQWLSAGEAADLVGVTSRTIRRAIADGRLEATKVGSHNRIDREDLKHYRAARDARAA